MKKKSRVGFLEKVTVYGPEGKKTVTARIDTGAAKCSLDKKLAKKLGIKNVIKHKVIKSAHGTLKRGVVIARVKLAGNTFRANFTLANREHMKYDVLIGRNVLKKGFLIDPAKK
jgi:hypothetical protein